MTEKLIQALHAGISRRDWHATEVAANALRDAAHPVPISKGVTERLREALEAIRELNLTNADANGHRWAHSDLIDQEIAGALSCLSHTAGEP